MIYHILSQMDWEAALQQGSYRPESLTKEGFIHCSKHEQVEATANRFYRAREGLLLLCIDPERLNVELRFEKAPDVPETFPHIYGALNLNAVTGVVQFRPGPDGSFILPQGLDKV
jgi:uncharacterized protein (DUF952 family)